MQKTIPFKEFSKDQLANRDTYRAHSKRDSEEIVRIPLSQIVVRESGGKRFNVRDLVNYGDAEVMSELAASLRTHGQITPGRVVALADGRFALISGHRRVAAWKIVEDEDRQECYFRAIVNKPATTETQLLLQSFFQEKPLEQYEIAKVFTRLIDAGLSQQEIAEQTNKSAAYISQLLSFEQEPEEIKELVRFGKMTVNESLKIKSKIPNVPDRIAAVKTAAEKKWDANEKKREDYADKIVYDENLVGHVVNDSPKDDPENIVKKTDNTKKSKRLKFEEVIASNTVLIPTMKNVKSRIEGLAVPEDTPDYNRGYATAITTILSFFNSEKQENGLG